MRLQAGENFVSLFQWRQTGHDPAKFRSQVLNIVIALLNNPLKLPIGRNVGANECFRLPDAAGLPPDFVSSAHKVAH